MFDSIPFTNLSGKFLKLWKYFFDENLITVFVTKLFNSRIILKEIKFNGTLYSRYMIVL